MFTRTSSLLFVILSWPCRCLIVVCLIFLKCYNLYHLFYILKYVLANNMLLLFVWLRHILRKIIKTCSFKCIVNEGAPKRFLKYCRGYLYNFSYL